MITERRQHPRKTPLEFTFIQLEQEFAGHVLNYSKEGLSFETSTPICDSDLVQFWLSFRQNGQIDGVGRITWLNDKKNRGGIAFVHLSRSSREKVDEWTAAPEGAATNVGHKSDDEESPEEIVSKIMEQVQALTERRHSSAMASPSESRADVGNPIGATVTQAQEAERTETSSSLADTTDRVDVTLPRTAEPPETCTSHGAPMIAATEEEAVVALLNSDAAPINEAHEPESTEKADPFVPPVFTPTTPESGDVWRAPRTMAPETLDVEATPAFNPPALSSVGAPPSSAGSPEPEQVNGVAANFESALPNAPIRKWPTTSLPARTTPTEQNQDASHPNPRQEGMGELVHLKQYLFSQRSQFLRGAAIGIFLSLVIAISAFEFWKPARQSTPTEDIRKAVVVNSSIASGATIPERASPPGLMQVSKGAVSSKDGRNAISSLKPPVGQGDLPAPGQPSRTSGIASDDGAASTSAQDPSNAPTNAIPRPSSFAYRNSPAGSGTQPLFNLLQPGISDESTADVEPGNRQPQVAVDLRSTPWSFHRKNIHGTLPVGGEVRPAELISSVAPQYPEAAKVRQISGDVVIDAIIDVRGNVRKPQVVSGPTLLRAAAVNAVLGWKYKPALLDGKPTEVRETITVKFLP